MKHPSTRILFDYWNKRRGSRQAPERRDIDPVDISGALGDTFVLAADFVDHLRIRLAGTRVCALFGREIKGESFAALWDQASRTAVDEMLAAVVGEVEGAVADVVGCAADGTRVELEMLILPLAYAGHTRVRALGALAPPDLPFWLGEKPVVEVSLTRLLPAGLDRTEPATRSRWLPLGGRLRRGFVVYSGGRVPPAEPPG